MLPLADRLRFMIFVAVFCFLVTAALLFLDISHVIYILPLNWAKLVSNDSLYMYVSEIICVII